MTEKIAISWEEFEIDMKNLLENLKIFLEKNNISPKNENFSLLVPCRGGEIIGSLAKNFLGLSESQVIRIKFSNTNYDGEKKGIVIRSDVEKNIFENFLQNKNIEHIVFLDDLLDSGETIRYIREKFSHKNLIIGTLYRKNNGVNPDILDLPARELPDIWIDFPWENFYEK